MKRKWLEVALAACTANLAWLVYAVGNSEQPGVVPSQRNGDFPATHIARIRLDLTSPNHWVQITWIGPQADAQERGPFRSSPGAGWGANDCNDIVESNCPNSRCTPKGVRTVEGFRDHLHDIPEFRYVTFIDRGRAIAFHAFPVVPYHPASKGCVRLEPYAARLIHDNSIVGVTEIVIDGTWTNPRGERAERSEAGGEAAGDGWRVIRGNGHEGGNKKT